jgi:N-acylneuraminate cytidylyltransferase
MANPRPTVVGFVPARAGSSRVAHKNVRPLAGHPTLAYSVCAARASGVFDAVIVSTDSELYADVARHYGAEVPFLRPAEYAGTLSPDTEWLRYTLDRLAAEGHRFDCFSILRPTSPFRLPETIRRAWNAFRDETGVDSLRAVEKCAQHPCKMWVIRGNRLLPLIPFGPPGQPWHSSAYQALPEVYVQNASLEIAWTRTLTETGTYAGHTVMPFLTRDHEGFDVNFPEDWQRAEMLVASGTARLPEIDRPPYPLPDGLFGAR